VCPVRKKTAGPFILALSLILMIPSGCHSNRQKPPSEEKAGAEASVMESRDLSLYLLYVPEGQDEASRYTHKKRFEASHIPQGVAAFFPARFTYSEGKWTWSFWANISYQIKTELDLKSNLRNYEIRASGSGFAPGSGRRYRVSFPLADLNTGSIIRQPALYALQKGAREAAAAAGYARLESIVYNQAFGTFKAEVTIAAD
jgi:hypothetical protein